MNRSSVFEASTRYFLAPIQSLLEDPSVTEVMINRFDQIYVERGGKLYPTECRFAD